MPPSDRASTHWNRRAYGYGTRRRTPPLLLSTSWDVANTSSKQRSGRKWTWRSPNGTTFKEYDLYLVRRTNTVRKVHVIKQFNFRSDHRLIRLIVDLDAKIPRRRQKAMQTKMNWPLFRHAVQERSNGGSESGWSVLRHVWSFRRSPGCSC